MRLDLDDGLVLSAKAALEAFDLASAAEDAAYDKYHAAARDQLLDEREYRILVERGLAAGEAPVGRAYAEAWRVLEEATATKSRAVSVLRKAAMTLGRHVAERAAQLAGGSES